MSSKHTKHTSDKKQMKLFICWERDGEDTIRTLKNYG